MEKFLDRLIFALEAKGFKKHGRATRLHEITNYSVGMISDVLRGKAELSERFLKTVCREVGISENWVRTGRGDMLEPHHIVCEDSPEYQKTGSTPSMTTAEHDMLHVLRSDPDAREMMEAYLKLPRSRRKRHVSEMLADVEKIEEG